MSGKVWKSLEMSEKSENEEKTTSSAIIFIDNKPFCARRVAAPRASQADRWKESGTTDLHQKASCGARHEATERNEGWAGSGAGGTR
jgi:hypothetical protein